VTLVLEYQIHVALILQKWYFNINTCHLFFLSENLVQYLGMAKRRNFKVRYRYMSPFFPQDAAYEAEAGVLPHWFAHKVLTRRWRLAAWRCHCQAGRRHFDSCGYAAVSALRYFKVAGREDRLGPNVGHHEPSRQRATQRTPRRVRDPS